MIKFDKNNVGNEMIKAGTYEVYANKFDLKYSGNNNEMAVFDYFVRNDVDQECQGAKVMFDHFVNTDKALWRMNQFMDAIGLEDGTEFSTILDWAKAMLLKPVKIEVEMEEASNGKSYPRVKRIMESENKEFGIKPKMDMSQEEIDRVNQFNKAPNFGQEVIISDDDLPF